MSSHKRIAYQEFGQSNHSPALERAVPELPPQQQNIRVQTTRSGRKGKTVTVISGFQCQTETLTQLLKLLKNQCGSGGAIKETTLEIQGDHRQKILEILSGLGYKVKISGA